MHLGEPHQEIAGGLLGLVELAGTDEVPSNDAADIAQALRKLGFDVVEGRDLDKHGMEDRTREFGRQLEGADLALLFYAGHGMQVGGKNYLVPINAKLERVGDLSLDTIEVGQILAQMEAEKRVNLVFLDACRDNPLARSFSRSLGMRSTSVGSGLAAIQSAVGIMIAYTARPFAFTASKSPARAGPRSSWFRLIVEDSASLSMPADRGWLGQFE